VSEAAATPAKRWSKYLVILFVAGIVGSLAFGIYINTESFQALVRRRLVAQIERITGGRAQVGSIHTIPFRLQVEVRNLTVHGRESSTDVPLAHADSITARLKLRSLLRSDFAFDELALDQPVIHVAFYSDGTSNFPRRSGSRLSGQSAVEKLFALSIDRLEIRRGQVIWDDATIPFELNAHDAALQMDYSFLHARYDGHVFVGAVDTKLPECRPFAWMSSASFSLGADSATLTSLQWNSGHSSLAASGQISDFRHPSLQGTYEAHIDVAEAAGIARRREARTGTLQLKGSGEWLAQKFSAKGVLDLTDLSWQDERVSVSKASVTTDYSISDEQFKLSRIEGKIFSGSFTGDAEVNQWLAPDQHLSAMAKKALETAVITAARPLKKNGRESPRVKAQSIQDAVIAIRLRDISAEDLALALNSRDHPIPDFPLASFASGTIEARWKGTRRDAEINFALDASAPQPGGDSRRPLNGRAVGAYDVAASRLDLPEFWFTSPASHVQAAGTLSATSALRLNVTTTSLADWLPLLEAVRGPSLIPVSLNGRATFNGNLSGAISSPQLTGNLQIDDFDVSIPATASTSPDQTHWDSLSTSIQLSFAGIKFRNAVVRHGEASAEFDASATLQNGHFTGMSEIDLHANVQKTNLAALQALAMSNYPITGTADISLQAAGLASDLHASGQIHGNDLLAYGQRIQQFDSTFHFADGELALENIHLFRDDSVVTGKAAFNRTANSFRFALTGRNFDLASISEIQSPGLGVEGRADFTLAALGTAQAPVINGDIQIRRLTLDHELSGDLAIHLVTRDRVLHLASDSQLSRGSLQMSADIQLEYDHPLDAVFHLNGVDLDALWRAYLGDQLTGHSVVAGTVELRGPSFRPSRWVLEGDLSNLGIEVKNVALHNQQPVQFEIASESLHIGQLHLLGRGTDLTARGSIQLASPYQLNLAADGHLDLSLLSGFDADIIASGLLGMHMTLAGTFSDPLPQGQLQLSEGAIAYASLPSGLSNITGSLLFTRDRIHIETLTARTGGGTLALDGDATFLNRQLNFNVTANGKDVRLRYPPGVSSTADAVLHWVGTRSGSTVTGDISVTKIAITPGFDFGSYLDSSRRSATLTVANSPLNNVKLDIHVQTTPELQMRTAIARLSGDADLRLRGSVARPAVLGRVDVLEGQATFHGARYTLERGDITFANPVSIEPQLNLQASTHVRNYDLNITVTGTPDHGLNLNYRSEPPLPKSDIIALLALGRTGDESAQLEGQSGQSAFTDQATDVILNQALDSTVSNRLARLFGASNIKIDPQGLTTENNPISTGPQITIEQEFANNLSLTYSTNVSQSSQQIIQGEYYINRNLSIVGTRDQNGVVSFDVQVRRRKK
jgi:translocation and assembly module TamB